MKPRIKPSDVLVVLAVSVAGTVLFTVLAGRFPEYSVPAAIGIALAILLGVQFEIYRRIYSMVSFVQKTVRTIKHDQDYHYLHTQALFSIFSVFDIQAPLPPMTLWVAAPDFLNILLGLIFEYRPQCVVEVGSGVSTVITGYALMRLGNGTCVSLDHEEKYTVQSNQMVKQHDLAEYISIRHAPLEETILNGQKWYWYSRNQLSDVKDIDLLIVDGPPGGDGNPLERYPAVPILYPRLSPNAVILVDDADRPGEKQMIDMWLKEFSDLRVTRHNTERGTVVLYKGAS